MRQVLWPYCLCNKMFIDTGNGPWHFVKSSLLKKNWLGNSFKKERRKRYGKMMDRKWSEGAEIEGVILDVVFEVILEVNLEFILEVVLEVVILCLLWVQRQKPSPAHAEPAAQGSLGPRGIGSMAARHWRGYTRAVVQTFLSLSVLWYRCGN